MVGTASSTPLDRLPAVALRAARLKGRGFGLAEARTWGLLEPDVPASVVADTISKREMVALQERLNPEEFWYPTEDKALFYRLAELQGIRVPTLHAIICTSGPGWSRTGEVIAGPDDWERLLDQLPAETFVMKPALGHHGLGIRILERRDGALHDVSAGPVTAAGLRREIARDRRFHIHLIQERLTNHPDVPGSPTALNTTRINTIVERDGSVTVLSATHRSAAPGAAIDNFRLGTTGNLSSRIDTGTGRIERVLGRGPDGVLRDAEGSAGPAVGARLPAWEACLDLVTTAAPRFLPARTIGWDVAVTPSGPVIVEANMWWDPVDTLPQFHHGLESPARGEGGGREAARRPRATSALGRVGRESQRIAHGLGRRTREARQAGLRTVEIVRATAGSTDPGDAVAVTRRAAHLIGRRRFTLDEAFRRGLLDLSIPADELADHVSKREMIAHQTALNPDELWYLTEDKGVFQRFAELNGIRVPETYAILCQSGPGWARGGEVIADPADWDALIADRLPDTFVVKPTRGEYGYGVRVIERRDGLHQLGRGPIAASTIRDELLADRRFHAYVVQERLTNHPDVAGGDGSALQTSRIMTMVERDGEVSLVGAFHKTALDGAVIDNFRLGTSGNLVSIVQVGSGRITRVYAAGEHGVVGDVAPPMDPATPPPGSFVPQWRESCELVMSAARAFLPMRCLGWDVAATPTGPVIIEANMWWDPLIGATPAFGRSGRGAHVAGGGAAPV